MTTYTDTQAVVKAQVKKPIPLEEEFFQFLAVADDFKTIRTVVWL